MTRLAYFDPHDGPLASAARALAAGSGGGSVSLASVREVVAELEAGRADRGLAPLEDGRLGTDRETIDVLVFGTATVRVIGIESVEGPDGREVHAGLLAADEPPRRRAGRTLLFCVPRRNRPGTLTTLLAPFAARGVNLTKLESRPLGGRMGEYGFVIEADAGLAEPALHDALAELVSEDIHVKVLGAYEPDLSHLGLVDERPLPGDVLAAPADVDALRERS